MNSSRSAFLPDYAVPPGQTLMEVMESRGITQAQLADRADRPRKTINEIVKGKAAITAETALQFERVLGVSASFWLGLEATYRAVLARNAERKALSLQAEWSKRFPIKQMADRGWIEMAKDRVDQLEQLLNFFGVANTKAWEHIWNDVLGAAAYRQANPKTDASGVIAAWLRAGEIEAHQLVQELNPPPYDAARFREELIAIRGLTRAHDVDAATKEAQRRCADCGVLLLFIEELPRARTCGASRWLNPELALIQLSLFYHRDDQFWFSFFHEAAHILFHSKRTTFVEARSSEPTTGSQAEEDEANSFAADLLISRQDWASFISTYDFSNQAIVSFADSVGVAAGVVVGRLQREKLLPFNRGNSLFRRLDWAS